MLLEVFIQAFIEIYISILVLHGFILEKPVCKQQYCNFQDLQGTIRYTSQEIVWTC